MKNCKNHNWNRWEQKEFEHIDIHHFQVGDVWELHPFRSLKRIQSRNCNTCGYEEQQYIGYGKGLGLT